MGTTYMLLLTDVFWWQILLSKAPGASHTASLWLWIISPPASPDAYLHGGFVQKKTQMLHRPLHLAESSPGLTGLRLRPPHEGFMLKQFVLSLVIFWKI
jgi:hypothetical protein